MFMSSQATCLICRLNICQSILKSFKTLLSLTIRMSEQMILLKRTHLQDSGLRSSGIGHTSTLWAPVTLVTVQTLSIQSADLGRLGLMLWSMGQIELDIVLMSLVLHGEIVSHIVNLSLSVTLTQVNFLQLQFSDIVALEVVLALTTLSLRDAIVVPPLVREGRRSHIRRGSSFPLLVLLLAALPLLPLENEKENGTSLKEEEETL